VGIRELREEIDRVDEELLRLLNRRARLAAEIGELKRRAGLPVLDPAREREVLSRRRAADAGPLGRGAVVRIFRRIVRESRRVEERVCEAAQPAAFEIER
jgi:chorismate mutase-like protein